MIEDAWLTMPPLPLQHQGRELAAEFLTATAFRPGWTARLIPARANGQPAFGFHVRDPGTGSYYTVGLMVLTLSAPGLGDDTLRSGCAAPIRAPAIPQHLSPAVYLFHHRGNHHDLAAPDPAPFLRLRLTELTIIIRWWMRVTPLIFLPSRVTKRPIKIRNEKGTKRA
jgi:hypothetical protein